MPRWNSSILMDDSSIDPLSALTEINLDDLVASFGWQDRAILSGWLRRFFAGPARKFALQILDFDRAVGEKGLARGAQHTLYHYVHDVKIFGHETLPKDGPV